MRKKYNIIVRIGIGLAIAAVILLLVGKMFDNFEPHQTRQNVQQANDGKSTEKLKLMVNDIKEKTGLGKMDLVFTDQDLLLIEKVSTDYQNDFDVVDVDRLYVAVERDIDQLSVSAGINRGMLYLLIASRGCFSIKSIVKRCKNGEEGIGPWRIPKNVADEYRIDVTDDSVLTDIYRFYFSWFRSKTGGDDRFFIMFLGESNDVSVPKYRFIHDRYTGEFIAQPSNLIGKMPGLSKIQYRRLINYFATGIVLYNKIPAANMISIPQ